MSEKLFDAIGDIDDSYIAEQADRFYKAKLKKDRRNPLFKNVSFKRLGYAACAAAVICSLTLGVVFADNIKEFFKATLSSENGTVEIDDIATVDIKATALKDADMRQMTVTEAEDMLGVDILTSDKATSDILYYTSAMSGDDIAAVRLYLPGFIDYSLENKEIDEKSANAKTDAEYQEIEGQRKWITLHIYFLTPYAGPEYAEIGGDAGGQKSVENTYPLDNIGKEAIVYSYDWSDTRLNATFVYNDMLYTIYANNVSLDEMLDILYSLK